MRRKDIVIVDVHCGGADAAVVTSASSEEEICNAKTFNRSVDSGRDQPFQRLRRFPEIRS